MSKKSAKNKLLVKITKTRSSLRVFYSKCSKEEHQKNRRSYFYIIKGNESVKAINE
ncbi:hypothetical protein [Tenacibaculum piscium]|uniref:hypothetical protein n=1 Tax=Tenacibaculum piscium TaxID=1458515 RepID=UPI001F482A45|nr:hypothetical protein [Tenacibaculum piscium]